ncbi:MAG: hypothetical protein A2268_03475 [Candidatus Raymondbacteria bacterium RifOxyA12_full_50_37]|uniref:Methyl-accepting transducer domain-containing protein n=1 Tax=Candidatus Raymondbacteria bacterium RIFOXYD12_FULL_49_13 TaxID=1817890 RepID=A0A1F7F3H4_UNCRA|nr:MAG: hypothetical protein A2268_03475 [Candidatus Raymondbacteria bacterium RifOxyA12_full_50_37]OGJ86711.1 MAG: hypothetical protein A2350_09130 [Candidatus Raymondbacteria bacterium RifOxyB12_full_50_8]OGJ88389.1 MAG: hypothetical protein A2248_00935 [Candidatus Raymondbacteria bacterium RIFOXYA2_FULL_49_16]OGJ96227.1 MAG: hypothetical protein A2453_08665 [Candidatus Raymondbacteria bacterium RIFOXYC2_FULL_50_21]OGK00760.1 MAG: hypothetical protein A2487_06635 [Candidatus Raymondbacteria b
MKKRFFLLPIISAVFITLCMWSCTVNNPEDVGKETDKTILDSLITVANAQHNAAIEGTDLGEYAAGSKATFLLAIKAAEAVSADADATQGAIDQAITDLAAAMAEFKDQQVQAVGKEVLDSLIAYATTIHNSAVEGSVTGQYETGSKAALMAAIDSAETVSANALATEGLVTQAISDLAGALAVFETKKVVSQQTVDSSKTLSDAAKQDLVDLFCGLEGGSDFKNADFSAISADFKAALAKNANNLEAQFGAAITELLMLNQSTIMAQFDSLFTIGSNGSESPSLFKAARLVPDVRIAENTGLVLARMAATTENIPRLSEIQDSLTSIVVPAIDYALARLQVLADADSFEFLVTPQLLGQGCAGSNQDSVEIDMGEIYLFDAALRILRSSVRSITAYNFDFDDNGSYSWINDIDSLMNADDSTGTADSQAIMDLVHRVQYMLEDDPDFLTLRSNGAAQLGSALQDLKSAITSAKLSIASIRAETDDQYNDGLKITDIQEGDLDISSGDDKPNFLSGVTTIEGLLNKVTEIISGPFTFIEDFDGDASTADASLTVNLSALYNNPIQDLRSLLPLHAWRPDSEWIETTKDTIWQDTVLEVIKEKTSFMPIDLIDGAGEPISIDDDSLVYKIQMPDWTFGGLFPNMDSIQDFEALFGPIMGNSEEPSPSAPLKALSARKLF